MATMSLLARARQQGLANAVLTGLKLEATPWTPRLHTVDVEATSRCNQRCEFCPTGLGTIGRVKGTMTRATFQCLVSQLRPGTLLEFAGYGEPFLHQELEGFAASAALRGLPVDIYSNLGAIAEPRLRRLLDTPFRRLIVSLDAMDAKAFLLYKRVDQFETVKRNVELLAAEKRRRPEAPQEIVIQLVVTRINEDQVPAFERYVWDLGLTPRIKSLNTVMSQAPQEKAGAWEVPERSRYRPGPPRRRCPWVWGGAMVFWNGDVTVCCEDPTGTEIVGNLHETPLAELVNGARADFRRRYFHGRVKEMPSVCRGCHLA